jgi:hypothetical protein
VCFRPKIYHFLSYVVPKPLQISAANTWYEDDIKMAPPLSLPSWNSSQAGVQWTLVHALVPMM